MPDREKVIALLKRYMDSPNLAGVENYGAKIAYMPVPLIADAIVLLKMQEPRVMTLEEVDALGDDDIVWIECLYPVDVKNIATLKPAIYQPENSLPEEDGYYCVVSSWGKSGFYHKDSYMVDWRCWTSRPTDEQREAVKWE